MNPVWRASLVLSCLVLILRSRPTALKLWSVNFTLDHSIVELTSKLCTCSIIGFGTLYDKIYVLSEEHGRSEWYLQIFPKGGRGSGQIKAAGEVQGLEPA